jgi:hypothetical protein
MDLGTRLQQALLEANQPVVVNPDDCLATEEDLQKLMLLAGSAGPSEEEYVAASQQLKGTYDRVALHTAAVYVHVCCDD